MRPAAALSTVGDTTFGSLRRHRNYRLYFVGNGVSFIGTWMQQIAAYWLVLELTGSPVAVGALALVQTLPVTALALVGGAVADRVDLRRMVVSCESVLAAVAATLALLALTGVIEVWQLYVLGLVQGIAIALDAPARHTLVFQIVGREDLPNAIGLSSALGTSARIIGPALGGLVVAAAGAGVAFAVNAVSYLVVICAILAMRLAPRPPREEPPPRLLTGVAEALAFAWSSRRVAVAFLTVLLVSTFSFNFDVLLPLLARLTLDRGAATFGLIASVFGGGALCGALIIATIGRARLVLVLGRRARLRDLPAAARPADTPSRRVRHPLRGRDLLRALGLERPRHPPARGAGAPSRQSSQPLLLRLHGRRAARWPPRRRAHRPRRDAPGVRGRRHVRHPRCDHRRRRRPRRPLTDGRLGTRTGRTATSTNNRPGRRGWK